MQSRKDAVHETSISFTLLLTFGFIRGIQQKLHDKLLPEDIKYLCLLFYFGSNVLSYIKTLSETQCDILKEKTQYQQKEILFCLHDEWRVFEMNELNESIQV